MPIFKGAGVAIVTPMKENLEVNYELLERNINYQIDNGTDAIIIAGTTGESATLSEEEHKKVVKAAIEFTKHRVPVIAGTGSNSTQTAIELSQEADKDGADAVLIVTPYYNKATQKGLIAHYTSVANSIKVPVIMYNVPSRTGCGLNPETIAHLVKNVFCTAGTISAFVCCVGQAKQSIVPFERLAYLLYRNSTCCVTCRPTVSEGHLSRSAIGKYA